MIEPLVKRGVYQCHIAAELGVSPKTVSRTVARGSAPAGHPRLQVDRLPAYAPELNPDELVWTLAKRALANRRPDVLPTLARRLRSSLRRVPRSQRLLRGYFGQSDLLPFLP